MATDDKVEIDRLRVVLRAGAGRVPMRRLQNWDVMRVRDFVACVKLCLRLAGKTGVKLNELQAAERKLADFWA